jgi:hypothetical protein
MEVNMAKKIWLFPVLLVFLCTGWQVGAQTELPEKMSAAGFGDYVSVMTRNIYIGADVDIVLAAQDVSEVPILAAEAFAQMQSTFFPERAEALADEIAETRPHLIGLQEVSLIRFQLLSDAVMGGTEPATDVLFNYLWILRKALEARGLDYKVAGKVKNVDVELPMYNPDSPAGFSDIRVTDFDVILARGDVTISKKEHGNYQVSLVVPGAGITVPRGWVAVNATIKGSSYRFVNTHLEPAPIPDLVPLQMAQAIELMTMLSTEMLPVILVGDFNSFAPTGETYKFIKNFGFMDAWMRNALWIFRNYNKKGYTGMHDAGLRNVTVSFDRRIDIIYVRTNSYWNGRQQIGVAMLDVVGDHLDDRSPTGLWPSDHAGVVGWLWLPRF